MVTVRRSTKITFTIMVIFALSMIVHHYYTVLDYEYCYTIKAFLMTNSVIGKSQFLLIKFGFLMLLTAGFINAVLENKSGFRILSAIWIPVFILLVLAILCIPEVGFTNIHLFWFICYILVAVGTWLSARKTKKIYLYRTSLFKVIGKTDVISEKEINPTDFHIAYILAAFSYVLFILLFIGALSYGVHHWELISGEDDVMPLVSSLQYRAAVKLMDEGEYEKAMEKFQQLGDYENSKEMCSACEDELYFPTYQEALRLLGQGKYDEARSKFRQIYSYKDSADRISQCNDLQYGPQYEEALALLEEGEYEAALDLFESLRKVGYKNVSKEIEKCKSGMLASLAGTWQGGQGSVLTLREDLTCYYVDGSGASGEGKWEVVDDRLIVHTSALSYDFYGDLKKGYKTTSILMKADSSSWRDETFTKD